MSIRNPVEWVWAQTTHIATAIGHAGPALHHVQETMHSPDVAVRKISVDDVKDALVKGFDDFCVYRTDVIFLCVFYPVVGWMLGRAIFNGDMLPLLFPLASGFAIIGPLAAVGLYEMSRLREQGHPVTWMNVFDVIHAPAFAGIVILGLILTTVFLLWLGAAWFIYQMTLGPDLPVSLPAFVSDVFTTPAGLTMTIVGVGVGFIFALLAMVISVVSFPLMLDKDVGLDTAIKTSLHAVTENPLPMAVWAAVVAGTLVLGSIPLFLGLVVVIPVLGHATWHLYRKVLPN